ncbi:MAG TPA: glycosyl hydrolase [Armatimonadota bacterium]|nr:glycosyl hydrolase [Armatimonadota bacterium]
MAQTIQWIETTPECPWNHRDISTQGTARDTLEITGEEGQVIDGFGGCFNELGWIALTHLPEAERARIFDRLFAPDGDLRFTQCRLPVGANDYSAEWYSYSEVADDYAMEHFSIERDRHYLIPYIKEAYRRQPQLRLFASPWSPPTWMKFPRAYNHGTLIWEKENLQAYALYFLKFIQAYAAEGITIHQLHVQNEPMSDQKFPSCVWSGEQFRDFIVNYLGPLFDTHHCDTEIWLGTLNGPETDNRMLYTGYDQYANLVLSDPQALAYIKGVSYQWAGKFAIQQTSASYPELRYMQSENECGDGTNTWEYARYIFNLFRHYLSNGVNSYIYWNMVLEPGGRSTWGWQQNALMTIDAKAEMVTINPEYYVMKHYSHFIQPGAVRLVTRGHLTGNAVVFRNPDGAIVAVVGNGLPHARCFTFKAANREFTAELRPYSFNTFVIV